MMGDRADKIKKRTKTVSMLEVDYQKESMRSKGRCLCFVPTGCKNATPHLPIHTAIHLPRYSMTSQSVVPPSPTLSEAMSG